MLLALEPEQLTPKQLEAQRVQELQQQAETRKRLDDEGVRQRLMARSTAAASGNLTGRR